MAAAEKTATGCKKRQQENICRHTVAKTDEANQMDRADDIFRITKKKEAETSSQQESPFSV